MPKKMAVGIVGYGRMGEHHARIWSALPGVTVAAVAEPSQRPRESAQQQFGCTTFESVEEMFASTSLDIGIIATHAPYHHPHTIIAIRHGCHVVCEKPMALTLRQCDDMVMEAEVAGVKLAIHHQSIFSRAFDLAKKKIISGEIGELYLLRAHGKGRIACSDLMEIAGHLVHGMRYLAGGEIREVFGDVTFRSRDVILEDVVRVQDLYPEGRASGFGAGDRIFGYYKFSHGVRAELQLASLSGAPSTFAEQRNFGYCLDIFGTKARLQLYLPNLLFSNKSPLDDLAYNATPWEEVDPDFRKDVDAVLTRRFAQNFLGSIQENKNPLVSGKEGRMVMEMTLGIYASHLAGEPLSIPIAKRGHPFIVAPYEVLLTFPE